LVPATGLEGLRKIAGNLSISEALRLVAFLLPFKEGKEFLPPMFGHFTWQFDAR